MGLSQTCLGNNWLRKILASANTPPSSRKSLQKTSNKVMAEVVNLNKDDTSRRCHQLVDTNRLRGSKSPHAIPVHCDGMHNYPQYRGIGETPFQPGTQCTQDFFVIMLSFNYTSNYW